MKAPARALARALVSAELLLIACAAAATTVFPEVPIDPVVRLVPSSRSWTAQIASNGRTMMALSRGEALCVVRIDEQGRALDPLGITIDPMRSANAGIASNGRDFIIQSVRSADGHSLTYVVSPGGEVVRPPVDHGVMSSAFSFAGNGHDVVLTCGGESLVA